MSVMTSSACGRPATALADAGWGRPGRLALAPSCAGRLRGRTGMSLAAFARPAGDGLRVVAGAAPPAEGAAADGFGVPELVAEAALLQARLDWFRSRPARLGEPGPDGGRKG
ncbi:hypothetical protein [Streptomyces sp. H51]|uniref:hypothetical protein n=1 Tax=Streptomyces sp. H51 TaxID=3111770 RepID=UPI003B63DE4D